MYPLRVVVAITEVPVPFRWRSMKVRATAAVTLLIGLSAYSSAPAATPAHTQGKTLVIGMINPFSGPNAEFGQEMNAGCVAAAQVINANGGVRGDRLACSPVDSKGDAAIS
jgi:ABC-type branched-subunit amino acid transport system substrate-binding protein